MIGWKGRGRTQRKNRATEKAFCIWYFEEIQKFINKLQERNFNPAIGVTY